MPSLVTQGAVLKCSFGMASAVLKVLPINGVFAEGEPVATIMDHQPVENICSFGMCIAETNPAVAAETAAAMGVPTPAPCVPVTPTPWEPGAETVIIRGFPALDMPSVCECDYGGVIVIAEPGTVRTMVP